MNENRIDLTEYLINEDKPAGNAFKGRFDGWGAGSQLDALRFYLSPEIQILNTYQENEYSGECFALMKVKTVFVLWRDSFGSCGGCDALEGENGFEYIKDTLQEGNTKQFNSVAEAKQYIEETSEDKYFWEKCPPSLFRPVMHEESVEALRARFKKEFPEEEEEEIDLIAWRAFVVGAGFPRDTEYKGVGEE